MELGTAKAFVLDSERDDVADSPNKRLVFPTRISNFADYCIHRASHIDST